jgi:hypothetical protein
MKTFNISGKTQLLPFKVNQRDKALGDHVNIKLKMHVSAETALPIIFPSYGDGVSHDEALYRFLYTDDGSPTRPVTEIKTSRKPEGVEMVVRPHEADELRLVGCVVKQIRVLVEDQGVCIVDCSVRIPEVTQESLMRLVALTHNDGNQHTVQLSTKQMDITENPEGDKEEEAAE